MGYKKILYNYFNYYMYALLKIVFDFMKDIITHNYLIEILTEI